MRRYLIYLNSRILKCEKILAAALLGSVTLLLVIGVFSRYVVGYPLVWSESTAKLLIVWITFVGASIAFADKEHITVDSIIKKIPKGPRFLIRSIIFIFSIIILSYMAFLGYHYTLGVTNNTSPILGISMSFFSVSMPVMFIISIFHLAINLFVERGFVAFEEDT